MGLTYEGDIIDFIPSKTFLGKKISKDFITTISNKLVGIESDEELADILSKYN
jgi:hypothetical protein